MGEPSKLAAAFRRVRRLLRLKPLRKRWAERRRIAPALRAVSRFPRHAKAPRHALPGELIVSLTSYPARFATLHLTIKSLLDQTVKPDRLILWVGNKSIAEVPDSVRALEGEVFSILPAEDLRSFTKIIPALKAFPQSFIVIADDDIFYPDYWLKGLVNTYDRERPSIIYHRGHRPTFSPDGRFAPYKSWQRNVTDEASLAPGTDVMPTGVGGVLYPPGSLPPLTTDVALFKQLSETCDDSWLYFMWRQTGWTARRTPMKMPEPLEWPDTQQQALWMYHRGGAKDQHLQALTDHFGTP